MKKTEAELGLQDLGTEQMEKQTGEIVKVRDFHADPRGSRHAEGTEVTRAASIKPRRAGCRCGRPTVGTLPASLRSTASLPTWGGAGR